jgi:hypothetical protein
VKGEKEGREQRELDLEYELEIQARTMLSMVVAVYVGLLNLSYINVGFQSMVQPW